MSRNTFLKVSLLIITLLTDFSGTLAYKILADPYITINKVLKDKKCIQCNLSNINMTNLDLRGVDLSQSDLSHSDLSGSILDEVILRGSNLNQTILVNTSLRASNMKEAKINNTDFRGADLTGAIIDYEALNNSNISEAVGITKETVSIDKLNNLGATYYINKKYLEAIKIFKIAIKKEPKQPKAILSKAIINYELGNIKRSMYDLEIAAKLYIDIGEEENADKILDFKERIFKETKNKRKFNLNIAKAISQAFFLFRLI